jgi:CelD/BcsL family acetyltransferase involved in cellulose biosynthesis
LIARRSRSPLALRTVRFICPSPTSHLDVVAAPADRDAVCEAMVGYLIGQRRVWDMLDLKGIVADSPFLAHLVARVRGRHLTRDTLKAPVIHFTGDWEAYQNSLDKKLRRNLRYFANRLEREYPGRVSYVQVEDAAALPEAVVGLTQLNRDRRHDLNAWSMFDDERAVCCSQELAEQGLARGWLRFYQLRVGDEIIAAMCCYRYGDTLYAEHTAFDPEWGLYSPGRLLAAHAIRHAVDEGARAFDWLAGTHAYKFQWTDEVCEDGHHVFSRTPLGHATLLGAALFEVVQAKARQWLSEAQRDRVNQTWSRLRHGRVSVEGRS